MHKSVWLYAAGLCSLLLCACPGEKAAGNENPAADAAGGLQAVTAIQIDKTEISLYAAGSEQLTATVLPATAANKNIVWSSADTAIATVTQSGLVTAGNTGSTTILAKSEDGKVTATTLVTVSPVISQYDGFEGGALSYNRDSTYVHATNRKYMIRMQLAHTHSLANPQPQLRQLVTLPVSLNFSGSMGFNLAAPMTVKVTHISAAENYYLAETTYAAIIPTAALPVTITYSGCCRRSALKEGNGNASFRLRMVVSTASDESPTLDFTGRLYFQQNAANMRSLTATAPQGLANRYQLAPISDSFLVQLRPVGTAACSGGCPACADPFAANCSAAAILSQSGILQWNPALTGLYAVQFTVQSVDSQNNAVVSIPYDAIVAVQP